MEVDILCRLSMMVGFLTAGFLALAVAGAAALVWHCMKASDQELVRLLEELERKENDDDGRE